MTVREAARAGPVNRSDLLLALGVAAVLLIGSGVSLEDDFEIEVSNFTPFLPGPGGLLLVLGGAAPLIFRRIAPLPVLALTAAASMAYQALGYRPEPLPLSVLVALYTVAVHRGPLLSGAGAALYVLAVTGASLSGWLPLSDDQYYTDLVAIVAAVSLGYGVALSRTRATLAEQRAAVLAQHQEARLRSAVEQEQSRIAREVHDIVAHDVSVMVAQAAAARRIIDSRPATAAESLASIEAVGRDALDGLRRLVNLLRTESEESERSPQPGLARLPWLLEQVRRAGLEVELVVRGDPRPLPATVELNAYRIVQEALTNSLKHAGRTHATVTLDYRGESLRVEVRDQGGRRGVDRARPPSAGYGLISMQQRAAMLGGELVAGPEAERGFRVSVELPVAEGVR